MKTLPFIHRFRADPSALISLESRRPFRFWMTGSLAVVMAAMVPLRDVDAAERKGLPLLRHSRFDVSETVRRLEVAARGHGLSVLARIGGARPVIVLACVAGGTLVVMENADSPPTVPMSLLVHAVASGGADVLLTSRLSGRPGDWQGVPTSVAEDLAALPGWVAQALA